MSKQWPGWPDRQITGNDAMADKLSPRAAIASRPLSPETRLAIHPGLLLKPDVDRAVLITRPPPLAERSSILRLVHPTEAIILSFLDGERTLGEVAALWSDASAKPAEAGWDDVRRVIEFYSTGERGRDDILVDAGKGHRSSPGRYGPLDFVVQADRVNIEERRLRIPYMVYYLPTLFCTQRCVYCYADTSPRPESDPLPLSRLREIFAEVSSFGAEVVQISGGEAFARRDILDILEAVVSAGMTPDIPTKFGLSRETTDRLRDMGIRTIQFSLDTVQPELMDHLIGVPGYHEQALAALDNLKASGLRVRVNSVVMPQNVSLIGGLLDYLGALGNVTRATLTPYGRSLFRHQDALFLTSDDMRRLEEVVQDRRERFTQMAISVSGGGSPPSEDPEERRLAWERRAFCTANRDGFIILPDGQVTPCEELYYHPAFLMGDLRRQSVMEMWNSATARALLYPDQAAVPDGPCQTCPDFVHCNSYRGRCWRDILKSYGWDKPHWPDPRCPQAPQGKALS
jgi:radical SAM protein with 4Fe4S-binding SPASM domain